MTTIDWAELCQVLPVELCAELCSSERCREETKLELAGNACMLLSDCPDMPWKDILKLSVRRLLAERAGRFDASKHDLRPGELSPECEPVSYDELPDEDRPDSLQATIRLVRLVQATLPKRFADGIANGMSVRHASAHAGIDRSTGYRMLADARRMIEATIQTN